MHADYEDSPFTSRKKKSQLAPLVAIMGIGSLITLVALWLAPAGLPTIAAPAASAAIATSIATRGPQRAMVQQARRAIREDPRKPFAEITHAQPLDPTRERQTVFNDSNYQPKGASNVASYPRLKPQPVQAPQPIPVTVVRQKTRIRDNCPYKPGSIEHRNCKARITLQRLD